MKLDQSIYRLSQGDKSAFKVIYEDTKKAVYYTALSILKDRHLAEDAMQATYLSVIKNAKSYRIGTNARAWIIRIAKNQALNDKKQFDRETAVDESENVNLFGSYSMDEFGALTDLAAKNLPEDEFNILMMVAVSGYKRREVASILDMPVSTVTWKYGVALEKMRNLLKND
ncbi:MAG: RNA polymerase sigma factor [Christensenellaceae bacterium]